MTGRQFSTHKSDPATIDALHDLVPIWMKSSLDDWLMHQLSDSTYTTPGLAQPSLLHNLERLLRTDLTSGSDKPREMMQVIFYKMNLNPNLKLDVIDGILQLIGTPYSGTDSLEEILLQSGSKWKVAQNNDGNFSLQERVDETTTHSMNDLVEVDGDMAKYISISWNATFGRSPNPSVAYSNIVKSIEAASWKAITPNDNRATLGTIIRELKANSNKYNVQITEKIDGLGVDGLIKQMSLVWDGQTDRHGTSNPKEPSQEATEQALFIAISVCQQFTRNLVYKI